MILKAFLALFIVSFSVASATSGTIVYDESTRDVSIAKYISVLKDKEKKYTINDIMTTAARDSFWTNRDRAINDGYVDAAYWIRFNIRNVLKKHAVVFLKNENPTMNLAELYLPVPGGRFSKKSNGYRIPFGQREIKNRNIIFEIPLPPESDTTCILRFETKGSMNISLHLHSRESLLEAIAGDQAYIGLYFGILIAVLFYNFVLYLSIRDRTYLFFITYLALYIFYQLGLLGLAGQLLSIETVWPETFNIAVVLFVADIFIFLFIRSFFSITEKLKSIDKYFIILMAVSALCALLSLWIDYLIMVRAMLFFQFFIQVISIVLSVYMFTKKDRAARYFLLAWSAYLIGNFMLILKLVGYLPDNIITTFSAQIGTVIKVLLLSFSLGDRFKLMEKEKMIAQQDLIDQQRASIKLKTIMADSFARFVPKEFLSFLHKDSIVDVNLGDQVQKKMTILFSDIRSFTSFSEKHSPQEVIDFLNSYLMKIGPVIRDHGGFIDKYIGDAIMALFPLSGDDAICAALDMFRQLDAYNGDGHLDGREPVAIGIGIHTGQLMLGTIGEQNRIETTVISDAVNIASRLEGMTKKLSRRILISQDVFNELEHPERFLIKKIGTVKLRGKEKALTILDVIGSNF